MKKLLALALTLALIAPCASAASRVNRPNLMFNGHDSQVAMNLGMGTDAMWLLPFPAMPAPLAMFEVRYSHPNEFFRWPGRQNIGVVYLQGWGSDRRDWEWNSFTMPIFYLSQDITLFQTRNWYYGTGMGIGMQLRENDRIGTKLVFSFRLFMGRAISYNWNVELFMHHFSNGSTTANNYSYNFFGVGFLRNF